MTCHSQRVKGRGLFQGDFCQTGLFSGGLLSGGFCQGDFCQGAFVRISLIRTQNQLISIYIYIIHIYIYTHIKIRKFRNNKKIKKSDYKFGF